MEYKMHDLKSYRIHTIKTDKFKNCSMEIMFRKKLEKNEITQNNMLVDMLVHSSNKYPKRRDVNIELENLYSASFRGFSTRLGSSIMLSFVLDFLNPKYCEKGYLDDVEISDIKNFEAELVEYIKTSETGQKVYNIIHETHELPKSDEMDQLLIAFKKER